MMRALWIFALAALPASLAMAQLPTVPRGPVLQWRGEIGSLAELYRTTDSAGRRPGETGRVYLNSTAVLFGSVSMGVNLLLTSEDGVSAGAGYGGLPGRQSIAQFGLHPRWSWGSAHLGTFTDGYTPFTYNGVRVTGAAFDVNPGLLRLSAFGGRSREAVATGAATGSYQRSTVGGRLGIGRRTTESPGTYFDVMVVRAADDPSSLAAPIDTSVPVNSPAQAAANPFAVTPEENLVVSAVAGVSLLEQRLAWRAELAASAHTRDRRATELQDSLVGDYPGMLRGLFTPRVGSHVDYAYSTELQLRIPTLPGATRESPRALTANLQLRSVGPGYVALGAASLPNDQRSLGLQTSVRFRTWSLRLDGARQRDNLLDQKLATTVRYRTAGTFTLQPVRGWSATLRGQYLSMGNGLADSLTQIDYATWTVGTTQVWMLGPRRRFESVSFNYTYQRAEDANPRRASTFFLSHSADVRTNVRLGSALKLTPSLGVARQYAGTNPLETRATYGLAAAWRSKGGRLVATSALARSRFTRNNTISAQVGATYRITEQDELVFSAQTSRYRDYAVPANGFNEQLVSLRWARRF